MDKQKKIKNTIFIAIGFFLLFSAANSRAANGATYVNFNVDQNYDLNARSLVSATLMPKLPFYLSQYRIILAGISVHQINIQSSKCPIQMKGKCFTCQLCRLTAPN